MNGKYQALALSLHTLKMKTGFSGVNETFHLTENRALIICNSKSLQSNML